MRRGDGVWGVTESMRNQQKTGKYTFLHPPTVLLPTAVSSARVRCHSRTQMDEGGSRLPPAGEPAGASEGYQGDPEGLFSCSTTPYSCPAPNTAPAGSNPLPVGVALAPELRAAVICGLD